MIEIVGIVFGNLAAKLTTTGSILLIRRQIICLVFAVDCLAENNPRMGHGFLAINRVLTLA